VLITRDANAESVNCGAGFDIAYADPDDILVSCEIRLNLALARVSRLRSELDRVSNDRIATSRAAPAGAQRTLGAVARATK
jgi:hypothetical protein